MAEATLPAIRQLKDIPALRQLLLLLGVAAAVAVGIAVYEWSQKPALVPLFTGLDMKDTAAVTEGLRAANIAYRIDPASGAVAVSAAAVHEARLKLASQGLPRGAAMGFEMITQDQGFGTSQFIETARYQHALETELGRTVASLQPVRAARVHLAIPKPTAFTRSQSQASASVLVDLHAGRALEQNQVASIVHVVASSVPGLMPAAVTVIDQHGHLLTRNGGDEALAMTNEQFEHARRVEADYVRRIEQLLTPMLGAGRLSAQVSADIDFSVTEEARESFKPESAVVRSEHVAEDSARSSSSNGGAAAAQGIPGATSNQPPAGSANPPLNQLADGNAVAGGAQSRSSTRNYELDRTLSHTRQASGNVRRLSVAVLVDYLAKPSADKKKGIEYEPLPAEQLAKVEALVKEAVGFNSTRGDTVSVQNAAFLQPEPVQIEELPIWQQAQVRDLLRQAGGVLLVLTLVLLVLRPALRNLMQASVSVHPQLIGREQALEAPGARALGEDRLSLAGPAPTASATAYEQKLQVARAAVAQDPKKVAQVVKTWVAQGE